LRRPLEDVTVSKTRPINLESKRRETTGELNANLAIAREAVAAEELREGRLRLE
jgi:hypothetical protein